MTAGSRPERGDFNRWLTKARNGSPEVLGKLFELCRPYLLLIANQALPPDLQGKFGGSDLVQQTFLEAQRHFDQFRGSTEQELLAWLRSILRNDAVGLVREYIDTEKRQVSREVPLADALAAGADIRVPEEDASPSSVVQARERDEQLHIALSRLPEEYRTVIHLRNYEGLSFEEIGRRLDRSSEAARKLWVRALKNLKVLVERSE